MGNTQQLPQMPSLCSYTHHKAGQICTPHRTNTLVKDDPSKRTQFFSRLNTRMLQHIRHIKTHSQTLAVTGWCLLACCCCSWSTFVHVCRDGPIYEPQINQNIRALYTCTLVQPTWMRECVYVFVCMVLLQQHQHTMAHYKQIIWPHKEQTEQ